MRYGQVQDLGLHDRHGDPVRRLYDEYLHNLWRYRHQRLRGECTDEGHSKPGSGYCDQCLTGKFYDELSNECKLCPKNTFTISGASDINGCTT
ncbi:hypothetical protein TrLO_g4983 [Triparma laevis f. longispina]|uniref:Tyrosine-protein kinase ephrin type A/B receptor-like domain-containing protein n=1 Tax=Triparma laevis f. longispina TaxID=1714387 RepID=A0A9W7AIK3_9STRA|nr:hypothetical protein TrLO_g4983 [Triparma laevis f. longispina]